MIPYERYITQNSELAQLSSQQDPTGDMEKTGVKRPWNVAHTSGGDMKDHIIARETAPPKRRPAKKQLYTSNGKIALPPRPPTSVRDRSTHGLKNKWKKF